MLTVHTELEGGVIRNSFNRLLELLQQNNIPCITLAEAREQVVDAPVCQLNMGMIAGRSLPVALQGDKEAA